MVAILQRLGLDNRYAAALAEGGETLGGAEATSSEKRQNSIDFGGYPSII